MESSIGNLEKIDRPIKYICSLKSRDCNTKSRGECKRIRFIWVAAYIMDDHSLAVSRKSDITNTYT